jgi:hypothetical protein
VAGCGGAERARALVVRAARAPCSSAADTTRTVWQSAGACGGADVGGAGAGACERASASARGGSAQAVSCAERVSAVSRAQGARARTAPVSCHHSHSGVLLLRDASACAASALQWRGEGGRGAVAYAQARTAALTTRPRCAARTAWRPRPTRRLAEQAKSTRRHCRRQARQPASPRRSRRRRTSR